MLELNKFDYKVEQRGLFDDYKPSEAQAKHTSFSIVSYSLPITTTGRANHFYDAISNILSIEQPQDLKEFNERYGNIRQELALKKVRGEHLSNFESLQLASLNSRLKNLLSTAGENRHIATLEKFLRDTESL